MYVLGDVPNARRLASIFGCSVDKLPTTYLGLPLGADGGRVSIWEPVTNSMERKLQSWKAKYLSFGARLTMIKSVLSSLPVYFLSMFKAPNLVIKKLERLQKRFFWAGISEKNKIHWVSWDKVKTAKKLGGLGVHDLKSLNLALLCKWVWRYGVERTTWWRRLVDEKCGTGLSEWQPRWEFRSAGCSVWKWIVHHSSVFWHYGHIDPGWDLA
ncbi:Putative ribonuclease H protein At1g65750 [Linum perenne]